MNIEPLGNMVLVEPSLENREIGGLVLPDQKEMPFQKGSILAVSAEVTSVKAGDVVMFHKNSGHEIDGKQLMSVGDLLAIIK